MIREIREMGIWNFVCQLLAIAGIWVTVYALRVLYYGVTGI